MEENTGATPPPAAPMMDRPGPASDTSKLLAALGYLFGIVAVIALLIDPYKEEKFVKFHAVQAIALWVIGAVAGAIPVVGWIVSIVAFVFMIIGLIKAFQSEYWELPVVYGWLKGFVGE